jgi:hypothetical protein
MVRSGRALIYSVGGQLQDLAAGDFTSDGKLDQVITKADL